MEQEVTKINTSALYNQYHRMVYDVVIGFEDDWQQQEDLAQDCWVAVLEALPTYDPEKSGLSTWITHVAENHCKDYLRAKAADKRRMVMYEHELAGHNPHDDVDSDDECVESLVEMPDLETPYDVYAAEQTAALIEAALSPQQMACLELVAEGLSSDEAADELGIQAATVRGYIKEARERVTEIIGE